MTRRDLKRILPMMSTAQRLAWIGWPLLLVLEFVWNSKNLQWSTFFQLVLILENLYYIPIYQRKGVKSLESFYFFLIRLCSERLYALFVCFSQRSRIICCISCFCRIWTIIWELYCSNPGEVSLKTCTNATQLPVSYQWSSARWTRCRGFWSDF